MKRNRMIIISLLAALLAALLTNSDLVRAGILSQPLSQSGAPQVVSYQGLVTINDATYTGTGYFKFAVVNATGDTTYWANDATASGEPTNAVQLTVSSGLFNVLLGDTSLTNMTALPASAFDGVERYLRVWFSSDGSAYTLLAPDRRIAAVPYALQAEEAKNAATAGDADTVDGYHASAFQQHYANVIIVAKSGGDYTTITAALDSITDASDANRYLVRVMPGVYSERVTMKQYVDIEGSGELTTKITFTGSASADTGTVVGASNAELRFLTVANTGAAAYAVAIYNASASPRLTHVTAIVSGGTTNNFVVKNSSASPTMTSMTISTPESGTGVYNYGSSPTMTDVTVSVSGSSGLPIGVYNWNSSPRIHNCIITSSWYGIYNISTGSMYTVSVDNSQVLSTSNTIYNSSNIITRVGTTLLSGGAVTGGSTICAGVYDEAYAFYTSTCP